MSRKSKVYIPPKVRREKIEESLRALPIVSAKIQVVEKAVAISDAMAEKVKDVEVAKFIRDAAQREMDSVERYREDVAFLRGQVMVNAKNLALELSVEDFREFGDALQKLLAPKVKSVQS